MWYALSRLLSFRVQLLIELSSRPSRPTAETLSVKFDHMVARREERMMLFQRHHRINELLVFFLSSNDSRANKEAHSGSPIVVHDIPITACSDDLPSSVNRQIPPKMCRVTPDSEALVDHVKLKTLFRSQLTYTGRACLRVRYPSPCHDRDEVQETPRDQILTAASQSLFDITKVATHAHAFTVPTHPFA